MKKVLIGCGWEFNNQMEIAVLVDKKICDFQNFQKLFPKNISKKCISKKYGICPWLRLFAPSLIQIYNIIYSINNLN